MTVLNACSECAELKLDDMDITHLGYDTFTSVERISSTWI